MGYVTEQGKQYIRSNYAFRCNNCSLAENLFLSKFWDKFTHAVFPPTLAPNTITVAGGLIMVFCFALLGIFPDTPKWLHLFTAFCCFAYQTFDGCDGKQARRTKSSSPLGELFDHGIDALSLSMFVWATFTGAHITDYRYISVIFGCMWFAFYSNHWEHHYTDVFVLGYISASDAQLAIIAVNLFAGIFGHSIFATTFKFNLIELGLIDWIPKVILNNNIIQFNYNNNSGVLTLLVADLWLSMVTFLDMIKLPPQDALIW